MIDLTSSSPVAKKSKKCEISKKCKCGQVMKVYWKKQDTNNIPYLMCDKRPGKVGLYYIHSNQKINNKCLNFKLYIYIYYSDNERW